METNAIQLFKIGTSAAANSSSKNGFSGKVVSILGDSISTFTGYTPVADGHNLNHRNRYPQEGLITEVEDCWWYKLIGDFGAKLGINDSWAGSRVSNSSSVNTGDIGPDACMASNTRITNLGSNGTPDIILFYGGTNDCGNSVTLGTFDSAENHNTVDLESTTWDTFAEAYCCAIMRLQYYYPDAKVIVLLPTYCTTYYTMAGLDAYNEVIKEICDYFGVPYLDLRQCGINWQNKGYTLGDGIHPTPAGADLIYRYVKQQMLALFSFEKGERIQRTITHNLMSVTSTNGWWKSVIDGDSYSTTLDCSLGAMAVEVTMGGVDITADVYDSSTGEVSIDAVTGDVVITARSLVAVYRGAEVLTSPELFSTTVNSGARGFAYVNSPIGVPINTVWFYVDAENDDKPFTIGIANVNSSTYVKSQTKNFTKTGSDKELIKIVYDETYILEEGQVLVFYGQETSINGYKYRAAGATVDQFYNRCPIVYYGSGDPWQTYGVGLHLGLALGYTPEGGE